MIEWSSFSHGNLKREKSIIFSPSKSHILKFPMEFVILSVLSEMRVFDWFANVE